ncbi:MAG: mechanosensitive ion channel family protein, partial [Candidatus Zixiibacteriota bacterium]
LTNLFDILKSFIPMVVLFALGLIVIFFVKMFLEKRYSSVPDRRFRMHLILITLYIVGLVLLIVVSPLSDTKQGQLLSLIGILLSAAIALSSTTFLGNIMAGLMHRVIRSFKPGDFLMVEEYFGRVSERGLFHTEIQTEDRNLMTLPNIFLVTKPVKVIRSSGTIVSAEISLGYDISHNKIEQLLIDAARDATLEEPFVYVMELGDFSVTYRIAGLLTEVKQILTVRSRLREMILDRMHQAGVEIVSPTFMNTRALPEDKCFIPKKQRTQKTEDKTSNATPEAMVFDKAEEAESIEKLKERTEVIKSQIDEIKAQIKNETDVKVINELEIRQKSHEAYLERLVAYIKKRENKQDS